MRAEVVETGIQVIGLMGNVVVEVVDELEELELVELVLVLDVVVVLIAGLSDGLVVGGASKHFFT